MCVCVVVVVAVVAVVCVCVGGGGGGQRGFTAVVHPDGLGDGSGDEVIRLGEQPLVPRRPVPPRQVADQRLQLERWLGGQLEHRAAALRALRVVDGDEAAGRVEAAVLATVDVVRAQRDVRVRAAVVAQHLQGRVGLGSVVVAE
eukprot:COSAG04_NODE_1484_length_6561_cov_1.862272_4_plen_144_part_00